MQVTYNQNNKEVKIFKNRQDKNKLKLNKNKRKIQ